MNNRDAPSAPSAPDGYELGDGWVYREEPVSPRDAVGKVERVDPVRGVGVRFEPATPTTPTAAFERGASEGALEVAAQRWLDAVGADEDAHLEVALKRWLAARGVGPVPGTIVPTVPLLCGAAPPLQLAPAEPQPDAPTDVAQLPDYWDARRKAQGKPDKSRCAAELRIALAQGGQGDG